LHKQVASREEAGNLDQRDAPGDVAPPIVHEVLRTQGQPIESATRGAYEQRFDYDFSQVQVHTGDKAAASATAVDALAYTVGNHVVLGSGYRTSHVGEDGRLLAHELVHVMQWGDRAIPARLPIGPADGAAERQARAGVAGVGQTPALQRAVRVCDEYQAGDAGGGAPSPGVMVSTSRSGKSATVTARLQTYGSYSSTANASTIRNTIAQYWNGNFPDGYQITTNVSVAHRPPGQDADSNAMQLDLARGTILPTHFNALTRNMTVDLDESDALTWAVAHEFGHAINLSDRYSEGITSRLGSLFGMERSGSADPGYEQNIMGITGGGLESRNVQDLIGINTPYTCVRWRLESPL
jgi:hypothetical protein